MKDVLQELENMQPEGIEFLERLVNMESPSFDRALVDRMGEFVSKEFETIGGEVTRIPEEGRGDHLMIRFGGESSQPIMLLGHTDTVWPEGELAKRPFKIDGDIATGPGIFDMKAGIAMMWMALSALIKVRGQLPNPVSVFLTSNEEVGSPAVRELVKKQARGMRAVLVLEPSLPGGVLKTTRNGMGRFIVKALGKAAHSGVNPAEGVNAIEEIVHQVLRIHALAHAEKRTTVTVTIVQGGTRPNVVPAECFVQVDARTPTSEEAERLTAAIHSLEPVLPGARLEIEGAFRRPPLERTPENIRLFELAREIAGKLGHELEEGATGGTSDGNLTSAIGIPTLDGLGPIGLGPHQIDEQVELSSLPWRTAIVAGLIERIAQDGD